MSMLPIRCPGCNGELGAPINHHTQLHQATRLVECLSCNGLVGIVAEPDLPRFIILEYETDTVVIQEAEARYFDLYIVGEDGRSNARRTHGWYLPTTRKVVQFG